MASNKVRAILRNRSTQSITLSVLVSFLFVFAFATSTTTISSTGLTATGSGSFQTLSVTATTTLAATTTINSVDYFWPSSGGSASQVLTTDGSGSLSWTTVSSGGSGTVTSVDMSVPTGLSISGNPITTSGTLALALAAGYNIPLTASTTEWDTAYGWGNHSSAGYFPSSNFGSSFYTFFNATNTDALSQGSTNLYYTDARVSSYITGSTTLASSVNYWTKNGSTVYYNTGTVGIGTSTPGSLLDIYASSNQSVFRVGGYSNNYTDFYSGGKITHTYGASDNRFSLSSNANDFGIANNSGALSLGRGTLGSSSHGVITGAGDDSGSLLFYLGGVTAAPQVYFASTGNVGIGTTSPTAYLNIKAGTASANTAPLKFTSGPNLTTPEAGAMEWDGTNLFITQTTGPTRKTLAYTSDIPVGATLWGDNGTYIQPTNQTAGNFQILDDDTVLINNQVGIGNPNGGMWNESNTSLTVVREMTGGYDTAGIFQIWEASGETSGQMHALRAHASTGNGVTAGDVFGTWTSADLGAGYTSAATAYGAWITGNGGSSGNGSGTGIYTQGTGNGDVNYGIYAAASGATTNWAGWFEGDAYFSDNVGIGTTSPYAKLSVSGSGVFEDNVLASYFTATSTTATSTFTNINFTGNFWEDGAPFVGSQWTTSGSNIYYNTGSVGIGTTTPFAKLMVSGSGGSKIYVQDNSAAVDQKNYYIQSATNNFRMGATNDAGSLSQEFFNFDPSANSTFFNVSSIGVYGGGITATNALTLSAGGTNRDVTLTPSGTGYTILNGNVGIGTTSPQSALDIFKSSPELRLTKSGDSEYARLAKDATTNNLTLYNRASRVSIDQYTKALMHMDGTASSTSFIDEIGHSNTAYGNAQLATYRQKFGTASGLFDGTGDYVNLADSPDWDFGSGDFTLEAWIYPNSLSGAQRVVSAGLVSDGAYNLWTFGYGDVWGQVRLNFAIYFGGYADYTSNDISSILTTGSWHHVAVVRNGSSLYFFVDGVAAGTSAVGGNVNGGSSGLFVGARDSGGMTEFVNSYIDEVRVSKGVARWTSGFTPETSEYGSTASWEEVEVFSSEDSTDGVAYAINKFGSANSGTWLRGLSQRFYVGANEAMRIDSSSYLGIGTTSPLALLTVGSSTPAYLLSTEYYNSAYISGQLEVGGTATSTFAGNLRVVGTLRAATSYVGDLIFANAFRFYEDPMPVDGQLATGTQHLKLTNQRNEDILTIDEYGNLTINGQLTSNNSQETDGQMSEVTLSNVFSYVLDQFKTIGVTIWDGVMEVAKYIKTPKVITNEFEMTSPNGTVYCVRLNDAGDFDKTQGACSEQSQQQGSQVVPQEESAVIPAPVTSTTTQEEVIIDPINTATTTEEVVEPAATPEEEIIIEPPVVEEVAPEPPPVETPPTPVEQPVEPVPETA